MNQPTQLIFLPGAGGSPEFWRPVADLLTHDAARKLPGWPGFGVIPVDPQVRGIADLVLRVLGQIDQPTALIAQSMGGVIALKAALGKPELITHLVLSATSGGIDMSDLQVEDWRPAMFADNPTAPRWFADYDEDISGAVRSLQVPALLLWGDADPISPVTIGRRLQSLLPASRMKVIKGGRHDLANRLASRVAPMIDAHLKSKPG